MLSVDTEQVLADWVTEGAAPRLGSGDGEGGGIEGYEFLGEIARGGMGVVHKARQLDLNRVVALKIVHAHLAFTPRAEARFQAEAEAAAALDHPNIVPIYEIGQQDGTPFFTMKLIEGGNLSDWLAGRRVLAAPPTGERARQEFLARLLAKAARAVQHAHDHGILHRDLKPSNILLDARGEPYVADFGLAKRVDETRDLTMSGAMLGTPQYMSPEQAGGRAGELTTASDIYSLGAILFEVLTGRPPFGGGSALAIARRVREEDPESPSAINPSIDRDLATVCLKCLEKEPGRRYSRALDVAEELERWLRGEPIKAHPATAAEKLFKWARRQPAAAALIAVSALALVIITVVSVIGQRHARRLANENAAESRRANLARRDAQAAESKVRDDLVRLEVERAETHFDSQEPGLGLAYLARILRRDPGNRAVAERLRDEIETHRFPSHLGAAMRHAQRVAAIEFSPDGSRVATAAEDHTARIWGGESGAPLCPPLTHESAVTALAWSRDGERLATGTRGGSVHLWEGRTGRPLAAPSTLNGGIVGLEFRAGTHQAAAVSDGGDVLVIEPEADGFIARWRLGVHALAGRLDPAARRLAVVTSEGVTGVFDVLTGERVFGYTGARGGTSRVTEAALYRTVRTSFDKEGTRLLTSIPKRFTMIADLRGDVRPAYLNLSSIVLDSAFSPDGTQLVTAGGDGSAQIWAVPPDAASSPWVVRALSHPAALQQVQMSADGKQLLAVCDNHHVYLWDLATGLPLVAGLNHPQGVSAANLSPDGGRIATAQVDGTCRLWDVREAVPPPGHVLKHGGWVWALCFSPDGKLVLTASSDRRAQVWNADSGAPFPLAVRHADSVWAAEFSPDGRQAVSVTEDGNMRVWEVATGRLILQPIWKGPALVLVRYSPDGKRIATASHKSEARIWDATTGQPIGRPMPLKGLPRDLCFSPDGASLATASDALAVRLWDSSTGEAVTQPLVHSASVNTVRFSPDGRRLLTATRANSAHVWDLETGKEAIPPLKHQAEVLHAEYSPDGSRILTASKDATTQVWDSSTGGLLGRPWRHLGDVLTVAFSPDGRLALTGSAAGTVRLWDVATGFQVASPTRHPAAIVKAVFNPNGTQVASSSTDGTVILRTVRAPRSGLHAEQDLPNLAERLAGLRLEDGYGVSYLGETGSSRAEPGTDARRSSGGTDGVGNAYSLHAAGSGLASEADREACANRLLSLRTRIRAYQADHGGHLPLWLSDLIPAYVASTNDIMCPFTSRTGQSVQIGTDRLVPQAFHFDFRDIPATFRPPPIPSLREFKLLQLELLGETIPLIRCFEHSPVLDLTVAGQIRDDPPSWETLFTNEVFTYDTLTSPAELRRILDSRKSRTK